MADHRSFSSYFPNNTSSFLEVCAIFFFLLAASIIPLDPIVWIYFFLFFLHILGPVPVGLSNKSSRLRHM